MLKIDSKTPIKIYTIPTCSDCRFAKRYFNEHQIPYIEFNCEEDVNYAKEVLELTGKQIVPTIVIQDKVFVGFSENLNEISNLLQT
ncbi:Glutaredoxin-like protein NrdH [compost metagenome]|jgi:glutaredoxin|uniref:NrdH-redoxin n=2 Tax=Paenibacillus TaxID=44249 RepID=A0ABX3HKX0_9BACL|nr:MULTISPECIES: glutaredoxin family protein [Paenibacillus]KTD86713.1 NrdH-redoxin [Paenibacillus etheri]OMD50128.1 NrdH-redoxin [Paenibacillus odorifer]HBS46925.1 glutaredoxin family protein [Paenibacillus sp.]